MGVAGQRADDAGPPRPSYRPVARSWPSIRSALAAAAPDRIPDFEAEFRIAVAEAEDTFDLAAVEAVLDRWVERAHLLLNPPTPEERSAVDEFLRTGDIKRAGTQLGGAPPLSEHDARLLDEGGGVAADEAVVREVADSAAASMQQLRATAASPAQVGAALDVSMTRVDQLRGERALWAIRDGGGWVFPILQFEVDPRGTGVTTRLLPGLSAVFQALPADWHPLSVQGFLQTPQPDLVVDGGPVTPLVWLRGGGGVAAVLEMAEGAAYLA